MKPANVIMKVLMPLVLGGAILYWMYRGEDWQTIWHVATMEMDWTWMLLSFPFGILAQLCRGWRWRQTLEPVGEHPRTSVAIHSIFLSYAVSLVIPRVGEFTRCGVLKRYDGITFSKALGTVVTERIIDILSFFIIVAIGMLVIFGKAKDWLYDTLSEKYDSLPNMAMILGVTVAAIAVLYILYRLFWMRLQHLKTVQRINKLFRGMAEGLKSILHLGTKSTILFLIYSLIIYILYILGGLIIFQAFEETKGLGIGATFVVYLFGSIGMTFSQGGIGVFPVLVQLALEIYGISMEVGTACGWLLWGSQQAIVILVGAVYLVYFSLKKKKKQSIE